MNLYQLRDRVNEIIEEHDRRGWSERNKQELIIRVPRSKRVSEYFGIKYLCSGSLGITDGLGINTEVDRMKTTWFTDVKITEEPIAIYGKNHKRAGL